MQKKIFFYLLLLLLPFNNLFSQCAGTDSSVVICNKEADTNYQTYNLFNQLGGTPSIGGEWSGNPINNFALNTSTGEVNLWAINRFGEHQFTYTNAACGESATITVFLGGYPGEDNKDGGANACSDNSSVNLYTFLDNDLTNLNADINGSWQGLFVTNEFFNAEQAGPGTYTFTYITNAVETCASEFATVILEVHRAVESGEAIDIIICETDDFSIYTDVNLFDYLKDEDSDGVWTDLNATNQITSITDSVIDIEDLYNTNGPGTYEFQYTVFRKHGVCNDESSIVTVRIPNITAKFNVQNTCKGNPLNITIDYVSTDEIPFTHDLEYEIRNVITDNLIYTGSLNDINVSPESIPLVIPSTPPKAVFNFTINPNPISTPGKYYITAKSISDVNGLTCNTLSIIDATFVVNDITYSIDKECFDGSDAILNISNFFDAFGNLSNDTLNINYTVQDHTNGGNISIENQPITFTNGMAELPVDISSFPKNSTEYNIQITSPENTGLNCANTNFKASLIPEDITLDVIIDNSCDASKIEAIIDAPTLGDGNYTITYQVKNIVGADILIDNSFTTTNITSNLNVNITTLVEGTYEIILKSIQNDTSPCRTQFEFEVKKMFSIGGIPDAPMLDKNQTFCLSDFQPNQPTLADIIVTEGDNLTWYENLTTTAILPLTTPLVDGLTYFVTASDPINSCESSSRSLVIIKIIATSDITSTDTSPSFCGLNNLTLASFDATANTGSILWYDAITGGNLLSIDTLIKNGENYYAVESLNGCEHNNRLLFTATIIAPTKPIYTGSNLLCALDNLTLFDLEANITANSSFELVWFDAEIGGLELSNLDLLKENTNYYIVYRDSVTRCEGERTLITFSLSECDPDKYDFFIPDGFSPNNDGTNDFYFIPNIEYFFPNYEYEIYNRYGQSIFTGNISRSKWNGKNSSGNKVTSGVYFYILRYNKGNLKPKQGRIYLSK